jgi:hypothetical protein
VGITRLKVLLALSAAYLIGGGGGSRLGKSVRKMGHRCFNYEKNLLLESTGPGSLDLGFIYNYQTTYAYSSLLHLDEQGK